MSVPTRLILAAIVLSSLAGTSCLDAARPDCRTSADCHGDRNCVLGECRRPAARTDASSPSTARDGGSDGAASACPGAGRPAPGTLTLNELLVDVPSGRAGDTNGDGQRDPFADEFVELVNATDRVLNLKGVRLSVDSESVFEFSAGCLPPGRAAVVFGALPERTSSPTPAEVEFGAGGGLELSNDEGTLKVVGRSGRTLGRVSWSSPPSESLTLAPQITGDRYVPHTEINGDRATSPGRCASGRRTTSGCPRGDGTPETGQ